MQVVWPKTEANMTTQRDWHSEPEQPETIEIGQPDPALREEQAGPLRLTITVLGSLVILGLVLYGLNQPHPQHEPNAQQSAQAPAPMPVQPSGSATTGAAPQQQAPAQDASTKGPGQSGQPGGQPSTTGAAPQDEKKPANAPAGNQGKSQDKAQ
jgi:hypothetical protein